VEAHILVVDDDVAIRELIKEYLAENNFQVSVAETGADMDKVLSAEIVDLVILDLKLPDEDGLAIARRLRESLDLPIIILTGRKEEVDRVMGLELGADDYVTKPFSNRELLARVRAVLRRTEGKRATRRGEKVRAFRFAGWELNTGTRKLRAPDGRNVELTNSEYALLVAFLKAPAGSCRATSCWNRAACTTTSTIARSTCRSCACGARSKRAPTSPN
jgi:DNA-binding response OmpR family regulator